MILGILSSVVQLIKSRCLLVRSSATETSEPRDGLTSPIAVSIWVDWQNSRLATDPIADEVAALKRVPGDGLLWVGGSDLASSFLEQGLLDEIRVIVTPILLGAGKTVFDAIQKRYPLKLLSTKSFKSGNVILTYEPAMP